MSDDHTVGLWPTLTEVESHIPWTATVSDTLGVSYERGGMDSKPVAPTQAGTLPEHSSGPRVHA
jgi:hypothetical protein